MEKLLLSKQPQYLEFSYETMCHTKVSTAEYDVCIAVPQSKKYIGYITLIQEQPPTTTHIDPYVNSNPLYPILIIYELNRFRKINDIYAVSTVDFEMGEVASWMEETIFYGSIVDSFFIMEDILCYKSISMRNSVFKEKLEIMTYILSLSPYFDWIPPSPVCHSVLPQYEFTGKMKLVLPMFFRNVEQTTIDISMVPYPVHHIQYKSINLLKPILNVSLSRNGALGFKPPPIVKETNHPVTNISFVGSNSQKTPKKHGSLSSHHSYLNKFGAVFTFNYNKPQYKKITMFEVMADLQYDVYFLYAYNNLDIVTSPQSLSFTPMSSGKHIYVNVAFISTYATSKMMNDIFRRIKENDNLDYIEESDDEDEFENTDPEKYVDLKKKVIMECQFNYKFKKWMPVRVMVNSNGYNKIVPISNL